MTTVKVFYEEDLCIWEGAPDYIPNVGETLSLFEKLYVVTRSTNYLALGLMVLYVTDAESIS